jgi:hypothetical protein
VIVVLALLVQTALCFAQAPALTPLRRRDLELRPGVVIVEGPIPSARPVAPPGMQRDHSRHRLPLPARWLLVTNGHVVQLASVLTASETDGIISAVKAMDNTGTPLQTNASRPIFRHRQIIFYRRRLPAVALHAAHSTVIPVRYKKCAFENVLPTAEPAALKGAS